MNISKGNSKKYKKSNAPTQKKVRNLKSTLSKKKKEIPKTFSVSLEAQI